MSAPKTNGKAICISNSKKQDKFYNFVFNKTVAIAPNVIKPVTIKVVNNCLTISVSIPGNKIMLKTQLGISQTRLLMLSLDPLHIFC